MASPNRLPRLTLMLRKDLAERVHAAAALTTQNSNYFVNNCIEGCINAMESEDIANDIRIVDIVRKIRGLPLLSAKGIQAICALFIPPSISITPRHYQILAGLLNNHEGELTEEAARFYGRLADKTYRQQICFEEELAALRKQLSV
jgi:predicted DNA-binding protein